MAKQTTGAFLASIALDRDAAMPLYRQLDRQIREAVLSGRLPAGNRLPSSRALAEELGVSRLTVQNTYEQLIAEGFLDARVGAGTFVAAAQASDLPPLSLDPVTAPAAVRSVLSARGALLARTQATARLHDVRPFRPGVPALDLFPMRSWSRLWGKHWKRAQDTLSYGAPGGYPPLREAVAAYLRDARGVRCEAEQVIIVGGAQQAITLAAWALLDPGDAVWMEEPGHIAGRDALAAAGAAIVPVPLDQEGLDIAAGRQRHAAPKLVFVTPSRQHPLGLTMSLRRRLDLLRLAEETGAWILEDDYDSEYRYVGRPLAAMQGLDSVGRVIYVGTFSKVLFPALRLGYIVCPPDLVDPFCAVHTVMTQTVPTLPQAVLADFIAAGHFNAHLRRMRAVNMERQTALLDALRAELGGVLDVAPVEAGMHVIAWLPDGADDTAMSAAAWDQGVVTLPLSIFCIEPYARAALLLGFTGFPPEAMRPAARTLARALSA